MIKRLISVLALLLAFSGVRAAVETTTVNAKVVLANGQPATSGTITANLSAQGATLDGSTWQAVAGRTSGTIDPNGTVTGLVLVPNDAITPAGTYYLVTISVRTPIVTSWDVRWSVLTTPDPVNVGAITRLDTPSTLTGMQVQLANVGCVSQPNSLDFSAAFTCTPNGNEAQIALAAASAPDISAFYFGDGSDGDVTVTNTQVTLTRDMYYRNLTFSGGGAGIFPAGFRVYVSGTLTMPSSTLIYGGGNAGGNGASGVAGSAGAALPAANLGASTAGSAGGTAGTGTGGNSSVAGAVVGMGGAGGSGGAGGEVFGISAPGGTAGVGGPATYSPRIILTDWLSRTTGVLLQGGGGGRGGGGGGGDNPFLGGGGGGGGGGGRPMLVFAKTIINNGTISANGGAGGLGGPGQEDEICEEDCNDPACWNHSAGGGGGGGGGGGSITMAYMAYSGSGTITVDGGSGGVGGASGSCGLGPGANGTAGSVGKLIKMNLTTGAYE